MGTRGAFGVVIGEQEKIGYNQYDSYPGGYGLENLQWLRGADLDRVRALAQAAVVVDDSRKPTPEQVKTLAVVTNLGVSEQSTDDWYCLTRATHGHIGLMLECGYINDSSSFPLDSLFCEWAYIVDFDQNVFEVYEGFQKDLPTKGRWAGKTIGENEYKAVELIASWPLDALPSDEEFLAQTRETEEVEA